MPPFLHIANIVIRQTSISGMFTSNEAESGKRCAFALRQLALCSCIGAVLYLFTNFRSQIHSESVARRGSSKDLFAKYISCASVFVHVSVSVF